MYLSIAFFLQMFVILATCRFAGWLMRRWLRQPQVIGEMIAGVVLGPSLLGLLAPEIQGFLFPPESKAVLYVVAQLGIGLYMFLVGLEFRSDDFRANAPSAVAVSVSGIVVPFLVAIVGTPFLMSVPGLFSADISQFNATLFLGAAVAITAFPVLARIIQDRGLSGSLIGMLSLSAAAIGDAIAWCVLAVVLASLGAGPGVAVIAIVGGICLSAVLIFLGPRMFAPLGRLAEREHASGQPLSTTVLAAALMLFTLSAWFADYIGLHAVFGGFLIGTAMPRGVFAERLRKLLEPFTVVFLLPVFFAYSGLNTQLTMVNTPELLWIALGILAASIFAKFVACWAAARLSGQDNRSALGIGALMNARGLTELIILNIGLHAGIIGPALFSMLVLMAIVTTLMASPMFEWVYGRAARARGVGSAEQSPIGPFVRLCPSRTAYKLTSGSHRINDYAGLVKLFSCDNCQQVLFFENSRCMNCGMNVGYCVELAKIVTLQHQTGSSQGTVYEVFFPSQGLRHYRQCKNGRDHDACNWLVPAESQQQFCNSCRLTEIAPDLSDTNNLTAWAGIEAAKRRLLYTLYQLKLPLSSRQEWPNEGVAFHFLRSANGEPVMTGHDEGIITLNIAEADSAFRENMREKMGEAYRTVLGHLRHEIGHYYWDRLIRNSPSLQGFRNLFGDDSQDYDEAVQRHYEQGAPANWAESFISAYATMHPWEDWAETWAHYLHMIDTLETAKSHALSLRVPAAERTGDQISTDTVAFRDFDSLTSNWNAVTLALNSLNRSMGLKDAYPFVLSPRVLEKLRFVHDLIQSRRAEQKSESLRATG